MIDHFYNIESIKSYTYIEAPRDIKSPRLPSRFFEELWM